MTQTTTNTSTLFLSPSVRFLNSAPEDANIIPPIWREDNHLVERSDLLERVHAFAAMAREKGFENEAYKILELIGEGFVRPFNRADFEPDGNDPHFRMKSQFLSAIDELSEEFAGRVSAGSWESIVSLGLRPDPDVEATIFSQQEYLPHPWWFIDANLHALGHVFGFHLHTQSAINRHTGRFLEHNCDCNHIVRALPNRPVINVQLPEKYHKEATAAFFTHLLVQCWVIGVQGLPTVFGLSPEGAELQQELEKTA